MKRLYSENSYLDEFQAKIEKCIPGKIGWEIYLSESAFYPESGGQPADHGSINGIPVLDVVDSNEGPVHVIERCDFSVGQVVTGRIDWVRRFDHMQHHTAQHILSRAFIETSGADTVSFHLGEESVTIDLSVEKLADSRLDETETLANKIAVDNLPVRVYNVDSSHQKRLPVRKPSARKDGIRIVEIDKWDYSPCGGTHCRSTGEIGLLKITRLERVRQLLRVHFCCSNRALLNFRSKSVLVNSLARQLSCGEADLLDKLKQQMENSGNLAKKYRKLREKMATATSERLTGQAQDLGEFRAVVELVEDSDLGELNRLASNLLGSGSADIVLLASQTPSPGVVFARINDTRLPDMRCILRETRDMFQGKGGGSPDRVQAGGTDSSGLLPTLERAKELIIEKSS